MVLEVTFSPQDGKRLPCRDGDERTEYCETASGLRLRVTRTGARSWAVVYWSTAAKTTRRYRLGNAARMSLAEARAAARAALYAVDREGRDPQADRAAAGQQEREQRERRAATRRQAAEERKRRSVTFGQLCARYVEYRRTTPSGKYNRPARANTLANWDGLLRNYIAPTLGTLPPADITSEHLLRVLEDAVERGGASMGPRVRELLAAVWRWIEQRPRGLGIALPSVSPLQGLGKVGAANKERERALSPAEVWRLWRATENEGAGGAALRLMLLTAARVREAAELERSELDLAAAVWRLPAGRNKGGRERTIPLSSEAVALLRRFLPLSEGPRVFGAFNIAETVKRVRAAMGGPSWQPRDLRRTAATHCARLGADPFIVALALGHAKPDDRMPAVTGGYLRWNYEDKVRAALDRLGAWIEETVTRTTEPGEVVSIRGATVNL